MACTSATGLLGHVEPRETFDAWEMAKARFLEGLSDSEKTTFNEATAENIFYQASNVQRDDNKDSKTRALLQTMQPLISAVDDYGKAMDTFANTSSLYLAPIWGSIRVILVVAINHGRFYNRMVDTFGRIGDILPRLRDYQRIFDSVKHQRLTQALSAAYLDIISLCTEFKTLLKGQRKSAAKRLLQPLSPALKIHLEDAVLRFRQHRKAVEKEVEICHMIEEKEARDLVLRNNAAAEARERQNRQKTVLSSLSKTDHEHKHRRMRKIRHEGTGSWFTASNEYETWLTCASPSILCLYGIPGCGKSVLVSNLIDELLANDDPDTRRNVAFYFCDHTDKRTLDPVNIFSSFALQFLRTLGDLPKGLLTVLERICQGNSEPDLEDVIGLLVQAIERAKSTVILLDGLDEVNENDRKVIFKNLQNLFARATPPTLKILVASREDTSYFTAVPDVALFKRCIGTDAVADDIDCFLKHAIHDLIKRNELIIGDPILEEEIFEALSKGAKGMFLWVKFQLDDLCRAETDSSIRKVLQNLPRDLGETYSRILARIDNPEQQKYIKRMFAWIICAKRPLEVDELREAIAFTLEDDHFDAAKIPNDLKRLARACGNLIVIDDEDDKVQIAHYTVEQYLVIEQENCPSSFCFTREQANFEAGGVCLAYLSFPDFELQITQYSNTTTSNFAVLKDVVSTQSMLPPTSQAANLVKTLKRFRGNRSTSTTINIERYVEGLYGKNTTVPLRTKYRLLEYVAENWLHHTSAIGEGEDSEGTEWTARHTRLFKLVAFGRKFSFDVRPWDHATLQHEPDFILQIGWAISNNHLLLLRTTADHLGNIGVQKCFGRATTAYKLFHFTFDTNIRRSLRDFSQLSSETWPTPETWASWLYRCIFEASDQAFTNILRCFFSNWVQWEGYRSQFQSQWNWGHSWDVVDLLLDAASSSNTSIVGVFATIILEWPERVQKEVWSNITCSNHANKVLETAFLIGSENLIERLSLAGCKATTSFKKNLLCSPYLRTALKDHDIVKIKLFLRIFGATTWSLSDIESRLQPSGEFLKLDIDLILRHLVTLSAGSEIEAGVMLNSHWIYTIERDGFHHHVDILLSAGGTPPAEYVSWLLREAIIMNRACRLKMLLKVGVLIQRQYCQLRSKHVQAMRQTHPLIETAVDDEGCLFLSPLSCAVFFGRLEMMEILLAAGAPVNGSVSRFELTPIHFAALTDSLSAFKCLERHGANLEARDRKGRGVGDLISFRPPGPSSEESLFAFLHSHRDSYSQCFRPSRESPTLPNAIQMEQEPSTVE